MESDAGAEKYHRYHEPDPEMHEMGYGGYGNPEKPVYATLTIPAFCEQTEQEGLLLPQTDRASAFVVDRVNFASCLVRSLRKIWLLFFMLYVGGPTNLGNAEAKPLGTGAWMTP